MAANPTEREALAAEAKRYVDDLVCEAWSLRTQPRIDIDEARASAHRTIDALAASPAAGGVQAMTDEQIIAISVTQEISWLTPADGRSPWATITQDDLVRVVRAMLAATPPAASAQAQADALDARRYRWLRTSTDSKSDGARSKMVGLYADDFLDAAIDAALASQEGAAK